MKVNNNSYRLHKLSDTLRDPETRALNRSSAFRDARAAIFNAKAPETLGRVAADLLRANERRSEELRQHRATPDKYPPPSVTPLNLWERNLLFNGRAPEHHTAEMRELRLNYGLSRKERSARIADLRDGRIEPSAALNAMIRELDTRRTAKAIAHFQASVINEKMNSEGKVKLHLLSQRIPPHERTFLYDLSEERKRDLARLSAVERVEAAGKENKPATRAFGAMPRENQTFRQYMSSMGRIERQLLNEALIERGIEFERTTPEQSRRELSITEARLLLPESLQREIRLRARNQAWQSLAPEEVFDRNPSLEAAQIGDTIAYIQEHLQVKASTARAARDDYVIDQTRLYESRLREKNGDDVRSGILQKDQKSFVRAFASAETGKLSEMDRYAAKTREDVYRAFEELDQLRQSFEMARAHHQPNAQRADDSARPEKPAHLKTMQPLTAARDHQMPAATIRPQEKAIDLLLGNSRVALFPQRIESDREWHFDSLREALSVQLNSLQQETPRHEHQLPQPADHTLAQDR